MFICRFVYFHLFSGDSLGESLLNRCFGKGLDLTDVPDGLDISILPRQEEALEGQWKGSHHRYSLRIKMSRVSHFNRHLLRMARCLSSCSFFILDM